MGILLSPPKTYLPLTKFVSIALSSLAQKGRIPTTIVLNISYYQIDQVTKQLISGGIDFEGYIDPTEYNATSYNYTLKINFKPLSHTDLTIAFALPWTIYMIMYLSVGLICVVMVVIFTYFHKLSSRRKITHVFFLSYMKLCIPPNIAGFLYSLVPQLLYVLLISIIFTQHIM